MSRKALFISVAGLLLLAFVMVTVIYQNHKATLRSASVGQNQSVVERQGAPVKGAIDARVTIVEFLDPACEACGDFYHLVKQLIDQYPGKVRLMVRYAPLHTGSDQVVKMLEAARYQGKFWQALELLFSSQHRWTANHVAQPMRALAILSSLDMDQEKLLGDMNSADVAQVIQQDVNDGQALKIRATPEFFVNGRPLPSFGYEQLSQLLKEELADAY